jgi:hypothetical protein
MKNVVLRCLAYAYAKSSTELYELMTRARMKVTLSDIEDALLELSVASLVEEPKPGRWQRI